MKASLAWSEKKRRERDVVDAVRGVLGLDPLYNQNCAPRALWLSATTDAYYDAFPRGLKESGQ